MNTKAIFLEQTATAQDFLQELCALTREHLVGIVKGVKEREFFFSTPGGIKTFRVCVTEEKEA